MILNKVDKTDPSEKVIFLSKKSGNVLWRYLGGVGMWGERERSFPGRERQVQRP